FFQAALRCLSSSHAKSALEPTTRFKPISRLRLSRIHRTVRLPSHAGPKRLKRVTAHLQSRTGLDRFSQSDPSGVKSVPQLQKTPAPPPVRLAGSIFTPGPMVEATAIFFKNVPLAPDGFAFITASAKARMLSTRAFSLKLALPTPAWIRPAFSTLNSTAPPF